MSNLKSKRFRELIFNKYVLYNSLFMRLPYEQISNIGMLLPVLNEHCRKGFEKGQTPRVIIDDFFERHTEIDNDADRISFLFLIIQYVERQVVLFDSIEDANFPALSVLSSNNRISDLIKIAKSNNQMNELLKKLNDYSVRIVFTAHPTQFYPPSVQIIIEELRRAIQASDIKDVDLLLQQLGKTSLVNDKKPTPLEEAQSIIYYLRHVYYGAIGDFYTELSNSIPDGFSLDNPRLVELGFWPGGDRDGNPFVTAEITRDVADELRMTLMKCYYNDLKSLRRRLSFKGVAEILQQLSDHLYEAMFNAEKHLSFDQIYDPLKQTIDILHTEHNGLYTERLQAMINRVKIFGTHFASLDIRQDHDVHLSTIREIFSKHFSDLGDFDSLSKEQLTDILLNKDLLLKEEDFEDPLIKDTIVNIKQLGTIQKTNGEKGCHRYIISNSEDIFSVLFVYALFRWCGWKEEDITFDIVPLFETIRGMDASESVMRELFHLDKYKIHIHRRGMHQYIMLGFSDGTKDGGYLKANWEIYTTKERLSEVCKENDVDVTFFDGRGGPPARGGGKTHRFYASKGDTIANKGIQLTIQGQTITSMYGTEQQFIYNCEQLITAGLRRYLANPEQNNFSESDRALMQELADISYEKYMDLRRHDMFIPYLEKMSTLKYYGNAKIGSRPSKRGKTKQLTLKDLRAISFVGSWSQLKQNVPGYFGIGSALKRLEDQGRFESAKALFRDMPFFRALILNSMMSLNKSFFPLTSYMKKDPQFGEFWNILKEEYDLSKEMVLKISGYDELMQHEEVSKASIQVREDIVRPLITIQQYALQHIKDGSADQEVYQKMVTRSLFGNINASRNSA